jgi:hypothetical protein
MFFGDVPRCQSVLGIAKKRLNVLEGRVSRSEGVQQGWQQPITLQTGEVIRLERSFNCDKIEIYSSQQVFEQPEAVKPKEYECLCNCNMAIGQVVATTLIGTPDTIYAGMGPTYAKYYLYDVAVCQSETFYAGFTEILGTDFTPWEPGRTVIVMAYHDFLFGCCLEDPAILGENFVQFTATGCAGIVDRDFLINPAKPELGSDIDSHDWRPTFRILPLCALPFQLWEAK